MNDIIVHHDQHTTASLEEFIHNEVSSPYETRFGGIMVRVSALSLGREKVVKIHNNDMVV